MGGYTLPSQDHATNTGETLQPQGTHLREEDEDDEINLILTCRSCSKFWSTSLGHDMCR